jgi:hypothetical protein
MIIQLESATTENLGAARRSLKALGQDWGHEITEAPGEAAPAARTARGEGKIIDPVSIAILVMSIPPAVLAVRDLADRIRKRRRAADLIGQARQLAGRQVTVYLVTPGRTVDLTTLTPDQLLDLAGEDPAS